jgi:hypothetical protein
MNDINYYVGVIDFVKSGAKCATKYYYNRWKNDALQ